MNEKKLTFCSSSLFLAVAFLLCFSVLAGTAFAYKGQYEVIIHPGDSEENIIFFKSKNFWGPKKHDQDLDVPRLIMVVASKQWEKEANHLPVEIKKELFYRSIVPLILLSNELILEKRQKLQTISTHLKNGITITAKELELVKTLAAEYGLEAVFPLAQQLTALLKRVDIIPPSLALGQAAYESGYGTSRFAVTGNAYFGQWTFSGKGMTPREHRASKGNYGVAAYDWPFDSVRSYMKNLNTHRAYQKLRDKRASLRAEDEKLSGMILAEALDKYSERGTEYVKTLQSIIRVNGLAVADNAHLRDEVTTLLVAMDSAHEVREMEAEVKQLRKSGELDKIIREMGLEHHH